MAEVQRLLSVYQTGFIVSLIASIAFFCITLFLFLRFDIVHIFRIKTGIAQRKTVQEISVANQRTSKLKYNKTIIKDQEADLMLNAPHQNESAQALINDANYGEAETSKLDDGTGSATVSDIVYSEAMRKIHFELVRNIKVVHTTELI